MGWNSGADVAETVIQIIDAGYYTPEDRLDSYKKLIAVLSDNDCDVLEEVEGGVYPVLWRRALVETGYMQEYPQYGEMICPRHYRRYDATDGEHGCEDCDYIGLNTA